jgi:hypothetical protein
MYRSITNYKNQNDANLVKILDATSGCCGGGTTPCQYDVTIPTANAVNNIIFKQADGTSVTRTFSPAVTGAANVVAEIKAAILSSDGFEPGDDMTPTVSYTTSGSNTIYHISGDLVVTSMLHNTSTTVTATARCTALNMCEYFYAWPGDAGTTTFTIGGADATLASFTLAGSTAAQVQAAIIALANWPTNAYINVTETATAFEITITAAHDAAPVLDGEDFAKSNCVPMFEA